MKGWSIWSLVVLCGLATQMVKLLAYSLARRRLFLPALTRSCGLPSLQASSLSCLIVLLAAREGLGAATTATALVMAVVVIHDVIRLRGVREAQRKAVHRLIVGIPETDHLEQQVLDYLDPRGHHPAHVGAGVVFGALFALAFGLAGG